VGQAVAVSERTVLGVKVVGNFALILGLIVLASRVTGWNPAVGIVLLFGVGAYAVASTRRLLPQIRESNARLQESA
jgi:zinc transporter ZupT